MQAKTATTKPLVSVYAEKGVLAFRFSSKYNPLFEILDGKAPTKQKTMGLGLRESPENWKLAQSAALRIERDLSDPDSWSVLFDYTFVKYGLTVKYTSAALKLAAPIPALSEITVGTMWEAYLLWKQPQLQPTTFQLKMPGRTNIIKGLVWNSATKTFEQTDNSIWELPLSSDCILSKLSCVPIAASSKNSLLANLSEAFVRLQSQGKTKLAVNPFVIAGGGVENKTDKYKSIVDSCGELQEWWFVADSENNAEENDRRAFTKDERDIIIKAFYESDKSHVQHAASLVEFRFLTGCRPGEAFALRWQDVFMGRDKDYIRFSKSYNGRLKNTQVTKTGDIRLFKIYPKLRDLLLRIKPVNANPTDLIFTSLNGKPWSNEGFIELWHLKCNSSKGVKRRYPGVVHQLAVDGKISCYLPPYHCRHTFITLMAQAGTDLLLLATACGNSVDVIQRHYLGVNTEAQFPDI